MALRLCANLSYLFTERPLLDRFDAAARAGFSGVEIVRPYEAPAAALRGRLNDAGLRAVLINSAAGDWAAGERGLACLPGREAAFRDSVHRALDYADALGCGLIHLMAGIRPVAVAPERAAALYAVRLAWAAEQAHAAGIRLTIEAINPHDIPSYFLSSQGQAAAYVEAVGADRVGLQFDIYHCQRTEGDVSRRLAEFMPIIAHVQIADAPGRNEPGTGEIGWAHLFGRLRDLGYAGWIGCEYVPSTAGPASLAWRVRYGLSPAEAPRTPIPETRP